MERFGIRSMNIYRLLCHFFGTLVLAALVSCAVTPTKINVTVDSISDALALSGQEFLIVPGNNGVTTDDLLFKEFSLKAMEVLLAKGYQPAKTLESADLLITLAYGIGEPEKHKVTRNIPIWGQTGIQSSQTTTTSNVNGQIAAAGVSVPNYGVVAQQPVYGVNAQINSVSNTTYNPSYGITGVRSVTQEVTAYTRYAILSAFDFQEFALENEVKPIWKTSISSTGLTNDLRRVFPYLIRASEPYLGKNTEGKMNLSLIVEDQKPAE